MEPKDHHRQVSKLFIAARGLDMQARVEYLNQACGDDELLRKDVERLLQHDVDHAEFLDDPAVDPDFPLRAAQAFASPKPVIEQIGDYRVERILGQGAMGKVYLAHQPSTGALVAIKLLHPTMIDSRAVHRFEREAKILGRLRHDGIAQIYDARSIDLGAGSQPMFVMEYVDGLPLVAYAEQNGLSTNERLELIARVADGVNHAHERGVVHRDLKPDNILVTKDGKPKILDFGIARMTDCDLRATMQTATGQILGTVRYMSPEQTSGRSSGIDARSDVYALGVLAHELLSGHLPYDLDEKSIPDALRTILDSEPTRLGTIDSAWRGDVETVIRRALEKDPGRRYESAQAFADDIRRHLRHEPIIAKPASVIYRVRKFSQRNPGIAVGVIAAIVLMLVFTVVSTVAAVRIAATRDQAIWQSYLANISAASLAARQGNLAELQVRLENASEPHRGWEWFFLKNQADQSLLTIDAHDFLTWRIAFVPNTHQLVSVGGDGIVRLWDTKSGENLMVLDDHGLNSTMAVACNADGTRIATGSLDGQVRLRDGKTLETLAVITDHTRGVWGLSFSPDGDRLITGSADGTMMMFDGRTGTKLADLPSHDEWVWATDYSPDGSLIASGSQDDTIHLIDSETLKIVRTLEGHEDDVHAVAFSFDGRLLVSASMDRTVRIWDVATGALLKTLVGHTEMVNSVVFLPGDQRVVSASEDGSLIIWDLHNGDRLVTLVGHVGGIRGVKCDPGGDRIASAGFDGTIRLWDSNALTSPDATRTRQDVSIMKFAPTDARVVFASSDGTLRIEDWVNQKVITEWTFTKNSISNIDWDATGNMLAVQAMENQRKQFFISLIDMRDWTTRWTINNATRPRFSPDGITLAIMNQTHIQIIDVVTGKVIQSTPLESVGRVFRFTSDGKRLIVGLHDSTIWIIDIKTGQRIMTLRGHTQPISDLVLVPDKMIISASADRTIRLWDIHSGALIRELKGSDASVEKLALSPDASRLVSASFTGSVRIWNLENGDQLYSMNVEGMPTSLEFSHDGSFLGCSFRSPTEDGGEEQRCFIWDGTVQTER